MPISLVEIEHKMDIRVKYYEKMDIELRGIVGLRFHEMESFPVDVYTLRAKWN